MFDPVNNYRWEAERENGEIITQGGSLEGCVRFSLIPTVKSGLPQHDFIGIPLKKRFATRFKKVAIGELSIGKLHWYHGSNVVKTDTSLVEILKKGDMVRVLKTENQYPWSIIVEVYPDHVVLLKPWLEEKGREKDIVWMTIKFIPPPPSEHYHCVECKGFRFWVRSLTGGVLVTPEDYKLYI